jgi:hypothetical protein
MDDSNCLRAMERFLAALRMETERFRLDRRLFASLCEEYPSDFTKQFQIFNTLAGKHCPDFNLSLCHAAGMVAHVIGPSASYLITMSPRHCGDILKKLTPDEHQTVTDLAQAYAKECRV